MSWTGPVIMVPINRSNSLWEQGFFPRQPSCTSLTRPENGRAAVMERSARRCRNEATSGAHSPRYLQYHVGHRKAPGISRYRAFGHGNLRSRVKHRCDTLDLGTRQGWVLTRELKKEPHPVICGVPAHKYLPYLQGK